MATYSLDATDRAEILQVLARYCRGLDKPDRQDFIETFWENGVLGSPMFGGDFAGHERLGEFIDMANRKAPDADSSTPRSRRHFTTGEIFTPINENLVDVWSQFLYVSYVEGSAHLMGYGEYFDRLEKRDGQWRFIRRDIDVAELGRTR